MLRSTIQVARPLIRQQLFRPRYSSSAVASASLGQNPSVTLSPFTSAAEDEQHNIEFNDENDPRMNGNYPNPPAIKRSMRDPYDEWWDPQERRNYGEVVHEDNDILGVFSTENYTHFTPGWGLVLMGTFVASVLGLCGVVKVLYPDSPTVPRRYEGGLERELGGSKTLSAFKEE